MNAAHGNALSATAFGGIARVEYAEVAARLKHVFLVGDLARPSEHPFVREDRLELILCFYEAGDDGLPHWHRDVTEYEVVVEGSVGYLDVPTGETRWFAAGDLSVVPAGRCVKRLVPHPARTVAIKVPSRPGDKVHCRDCQRACPVRLEAYRG